MPTSTDLVTSLPADFEVFGQAVDSTLADLKGGTTGQVLSKNSNTDMDFVWVTDAAGDITGVTAGTGISGGGTSGTVTITNSMATEITAKGDLIVGTGSATFDNLAAGANGSTLVADSSTSTGLRWQGSQAAGKNLIINGAMQIWQRGTSFTSNSSVTNYTADRWVGQSNATTTFSRQATGDTTNLPFIQYCLRIQRNSGATGTDWINVAYSAESTDSIPFAGRTVTVSFYARKGANFNDGTAALYFSLLSGTGTDQNSLSGYTGNATVATINPTLTTTWQRFSVTGTVSATATEIGINASFRGAGTAGAADYWELTGVQVELGSVATAFRTATGTIQGELAACQRYYWRYTQTAAYQPFGTGFNYNTTQSNQVVTLPVTMRTSPSLGFSAANQFAVQHNTNVTTLTSISADRVAPDKISVSAVVSSGLTSGQGAILSGQTGTTAYIEASAEL